MSDERTCEVTVSGGLICEVPAIGRADPPGWNLCQEHYLVALVAGWNPQTFATALSDTRETENAPKENA